ncbi:hypothetical protein C8R43DRAFT_954288 [Mycena crocata]|nr:hypothetical protein C8R43DRAFT_954288 [Mycena crocata]
MQNMPPELLTKIMRMVVNPFDDEPKDYGYQLKKIEAVNKIWRAVVDSDSIMWCNIYVDNRTLFCHLIRTITKAHKCGHPINIRYRLHIPAGAGPHPDVLQTDEHGTPLELEEFLRRTTDIIAPITKRCSLIWISAATRESSMALLKEVGKWDMKAAEEVDLDLSAAIVRDQDAYGKLGVFKGAWIRKIRLTNAFTLNFEGAHYGKLTSLTLEEYTRYIPSQENLMDALAGMHQLEILKLIRMACLSPVARRRVTLAHLSHLQIEAWDMGPSIGNVVMDLVMPALWSACIGTEDEDTIAPLAALCGEALHGVTRLELKLVISGYKSLADILNATPNVVKVDMRNTLTREQYLEAIGDDSRADEDLPDTTSFFIDMINNVKPKWLKLKHVHLKDEVTEVELGQIRRWGDRGVDARGQDAEAQGY